MIIVNTSNEELLKSVKDDMDRLQDEAEDALDENEKEAKEIAKNHGEDTKGLKKVVSKDDLKDLKSMHLAESLFDDADEDSYHSDVIDACDAFRNGDMSLDELIDELTFIKDRMDNGVERVNYDLPGFDEVQGMLDKLTIYGESLNEDLSPKGKKLIAELKQELGPELQRKVVALMKDLQTSLTQNKKDEDKQTLGNGSLKESYEFIDSKPRGITLEKEVGTNHYIVLDNGRPFGEIYADSDKEAKKKFQNALWSFIPKKKDISYQGPGEYHFYYMKDDDDEGWDRGWDEPRSMYKCTVYDEDDFNSEVNDNQYLQDGIIYLVRTEKVLNTNESLMESMWSVYYVDDDPQEGTLFTEEEDAKKFQTEMGEDWKVTKLEEAVKRYSDKTPVEDRKYWYFTKHGIGPGVWPKDLHLVDFVEDDNWGTYICLDGVCNKDELDKYELVEKKPPEELFNESLKEEFDWDFQSEEESKIQKALKRKLNTVVNVSVSTNDDDNGVEVWVEPYPEDKDICIKVLEKFGYAFVKDCGASSNNGTKELLFKGTRG